MSARLTGIYTLTPTHVGTGEADLVVDLPVAREHFTGLPYLPGSSLKGVARAFVQRSENDAKGGSERVVGWFGSDAPGRGNADRAKGTSQEGGTTPGSLVFSEGQLLAWPCRSLNAPTLWATSPLLLERVDRLARAHGITWLDEGMRRALTHAWSKLKADEASASDLAPRLVLEDLCLPAVSSHADLPRLAKLIAALLPTGEETATRLSGRLVVLADATLQRLVRRAIPVHARIQLTDNKTTSKSGDQSGNLWYEEVVPADALFACLVSERVATRTPIEVPPLWAPTKGGPNKHAVVQIGGNETVGQGLCWWTQGRA